MQKGPSDNLIAYKIISLCEDLSAIEKRVSSLIVDHHNRKTGQCDPSLGTMARLLGVSRRTAIRAVNAVVRKGYFHMRRHGGKFHRNHYEPNWARFRAMEEKWNSQRRKNSSPLQGQSCHIDGDVGVTQTSSKNPFEKNPCLETANQFQASHSRIAEKGLSRASQSTPQRFVANERFHVKATSSRDAARDAAETRWNNAFMKQLKAAPDVFAELVNAIDEELHRATTEMELRKPGSGLPYLLSELDRRRPLTTASATVSNPPRCTGPSCKVSIAGNSDRGGSPVRSDFHSLKTKHESLNTEPKLPCRSGRVKV